MCLQHKRPTMYERTSHWTVQQPKVPRHPALSALDGFVCKAFATAENTPSANNRPSPIAKERTCCMRSLTVVCVRVAYWLPLWGAIVGPGKQHGSTAGQNVVSASSQEVPGGMCNNSLVLRSMLQHVPALPDYLNLLSRLNARNKPTLAEHTCKAACWPPPATSKSTDRQPSFGRDRASRPPGRLKDLRNIGSRRVGPRLSRPDHHRPCQ